MDTYGSMRARLLETGLYRLDGGTLADCELKAYAAGLDPVRGALTELQRESFAETAEGYGLENRERAFRLSSSGETDARRAAVLAMGTVTPDSFTKAGLEAALAALGLDVSLEERAEGRKLIAHFLKMPDCGEAEAVKKLEIFLPAHLACEPDFSGIS